MHGNALYNVVSWKFIKRAGMWFYARRGDGESGYWHLHEGQNPANWGEHPVDFKKRSNTYFCRDCGRLMPAPETIKWEPQQSPS